MEKCRDGQKLHKDELKSIVEFYLETLYVLTLNPEDAERAADLKGA